VGFYFNVIRIALLAFLRLSEQLVDAVAVSQILFLKIVLLLLRHYKLSDKTDGFGLLIK
jgi:hypothetical protein